MSKATILLADDNLRLHEIEPQFEIVGSVYDGRALVEATAKLRPDLIVTDMPIVNGLEAAEELRKSGAIVPMVFLTIHTDADIIKACIDADGVYVSKHAVHVDLIPAIYAALGTGGHEN